MIHITHMICQPKCQVEIFTMTHFHSLFQKLPLLRPNLEGMLFMLVCWEEISQEIEILADAAYRFCPLWMSSHKNKI